MPIVFGHTVYMCGRYRLSRRKQILEEQFAAISDDADWRPRYNIAPTQFVPAVRQNARSTNREISMIRWGPRSFMGEVFWILHRRHAHPSFFIIKLVSFLFAGLTLLVLSRLGLA